MVLFFGKVDNYQYIYYIPTTTSSLLMNITALQKLEKGYIQLDWKSYIHKIELSREHMETIIDLIDVFKFNKKTDELVIFRFQGIPAYITIPKTEYKELLDWMYERMIRYEFFENCKRINDLIKVL